MPDQTARFEWVLTVARIALVATWVVLLISLSWTVAVLIGEFHRGALWPDVLASVALLVSEAMAGAWAFVIYGAVHVMLVRSTSTSSALGQLSRLETLLEDQSSSTRKMIDLATLSDEAKSLLYRDRELEAMREMMHGMLVRQDYKAAEELVASIEQRPSYAQEAANMREEIGTTRKAGMDEKIDMAVRRVEEIMVRADWARAAREAQRMLQALPNNPKIAALPQRIEAARAKHKRDLLQSYGEAVRKNDIDGSIDLLKQLDRYLTPQEGAALQDSARGVFRAKLHNLGVQFAICVTDRQWEQALAVGEEIVRGYPNSRMAHEVRAKMDQLHQRATAPPAPAQPVPAQASPPAGPQASAK